MTWSWERDISWRSLELIHSIHSIDRQEMFLLIIWTRLSKVSCTRNISVRLRDYGFQSQQPSGNVPTIWNTKEWYYRLFIRSDIGHKMNHMVVLGGLVYLINNRTAPGYLTLFKSVQLLIVAITKSITWHSNYTNVVVAKDILFLFFLTAAITYWNR